MVLESLGPVNASRQRGLRPPHRVPSLGTMGTWIAALAVAASLAGALAAEAKPPWHRRGTTDLNLFVPLDPEPPRTHWMHRDDRRLVPPTVSIGGSPYVCDVDALSFSTRESFVAHLRTTHFLPSDRIPELLYRLGGEVHFAGE